MSHDRGCFFCGKEPFEYRSCTNRDCPKKKLPKPTKYAKRIDAVTERVMTITEEELFDLGLTRLQFAQREMNALFDELIKRD